MFQNCHITDIFSQRYWPSVPSMKICRHYRYQVPHEVADELRDADPLPCDVCDAVFNHLGNRPPFAEGRFVFPVEFGANLQVTPMLAKT